MSKLLYIHKPSLTAVIQYNPHPDVEKIALVDMLAVAERALKGETSTTQPEAVLASLMKRRWRLNQPIPFEGSPHELIDLFMHYHPQHLVEGATS
jgi:hypothetical protein